MICPGALLDPVYFFFHVVLVTQIARWFPMCLLTYRHYLSVHVLHLMGVSVSCDYRIFTVFFPRKLAFSMAISILFVFLVPVFIRIGIDVEQNYVTVSLCIFIFDFGTALTLALYKLLTYLHRFLFGGTFFCVMSLVEAARVRVS